MPLSSIHFSAGFEVITLQSTTSNVVVYSTMQGGTVDSTPASQGEGPALRLSWDLFCVELAVHPPCAVVFTR